MTARPARLTLAAMRLAVLALVSLLSGCFANRAVGRVSLGVATAALITDWVQTHPYAAAGWKTVVARGENSTTFRAYTEGNPILGERPSTGDLGLYFSTAIVLNAVLWYVLPQRLRLPAMLAVTSVQIHAIVNNAGRAGP